MIGVRVVQDVAKYFKNHLTFTEARMLEKRAQQGGCSRLRRYLCNFFLEVSRKVVFERYDDRIGGCNKGIFFDGSQAFDE